MNRIPCIFVTVLWGCAVVFGLGKLWRYESAPGLSVPPPVQWPAGSRLPRVPGRWTLVLAEHPHCPCSRATLRELAIALAHCDRPITICVLFYAPGRAPLGWEKTDLYDLAAAIPGVRVLRDDDGAEALRFHATTSGQTLLFDAGGHLRFSGGITGARGHEGGNAGRDALVALLTGRMPALTRTPVFGCSLLGIGSK